MSFFGTSTPTTKDILLGMISELKALHKKRRLDLTTGVPDILLSAFATAAAGVPSNHIGDAPPSNTIGEYTERCARRNATTLKQVESVIATLRSIIATIDIAPGIAAEFEAKIRQSAATPTEILVLGHFATKTAEEQHAGSMNKRSRFY